MTGFAFTEAQQAAYDTARDFGQSRLNDDLVARDRDGARTPEIWRALWALCGEAGLPGRHVPQAYGGEGADIVATIAALEGLGRGCRDNGFTLGLNGQIWSVIEPLLEFGSEAQKQAYLPGLCAGTLIGADATTEAASGSDALAAATRAEPCDGGYVLNGEKIYVGHGPICDIALVLASVRPEHGRWGLGIFIVEASDAGFERGAPAQKMGLRSLPAGTLTFRDCFVDSSRRLGGVGDGASIFQHSMESERCFILSSHVGAMARQLDDCVTFARERQVFGQAISGYQSVSNRLADMRVRLEACRLMLYQVAALKAEGASCALESAMAKLFISEAFSASSLDAIRIHGGRGYMEDAEVERDMRDAIGDLLLAGTSDIQRQLIASMLGTV